MQISYIDIHTHKTDRAGPDIRALVSLQPSMLKKNLHDSVSAFSCGVHPWYIKNMSQVEEDFTTMESVREHAAFLALGEAGLDKHTDVAFSLQKEVFMQHITLSEQLCKPLVIHCVKAWDEVLHIRKESRAKQTWIFHGFNSSHEMARQIIDAGCMLSFGKLLFNTNTKAARVFSDLSGESFFLETDDSDISIEEVYHHAAHLRDTTVEALKKQLFENFLSVFPNS